MFFWIWIKARDFMVPDPVFGAGSWPIFKRLDKTTTYFFQIAILVLVIFLDYLFRFQMQHLPFSSWFWFFGLSHNDSGFGPYSLLFIQVSDEKFFSLLDLVSVFLIKYRFRIQIPLTIGFENLTYGLHYDHYPPMKLSLLRCDGGIVLALFLVVKQNPYH